MCVAFSAMHKATRSGNRTFISAGASVPGVSWNSILIPSTTRVSPVAVMESVGMIRVTVPVEVVWPRPAPICPPALRSRAAPYMYPARRAIAAPA